VRGRACNGSGCTSKFGGDPLFLARSREAASSRDDQSQVRVKAPSERAGRTSGTKILPFIRGKDEARREFAVLAQLVRALAS
jgi:hypothetical protein